MIIALIAHSRAGVKDVRTVERVRQKVTLEGEDLAGNR